jgi:hypothetical protein
VIEGAFGLQSLLQSKLPLHNENRSAAELDTTILVGLGAILVDAVNAGFGDAQHPVDSIVVGDEQRNLLRGPQSGKETELVVVALGLTPIRM